MTLRELLRRRPGAVEMVDLIDAVDVVLDAMDSDDWDALKTALRCLAKRYAAVRTISQTDVPDDWDA